MMTNIINVKGPLFVYSAGGQALAFNEGTGGAKSPPDCRHGLADVQTAGLGKCCRRGRNEGTRVSAWLILQSLQVQGRAGGRSGCQRIRSCAKETVGGHRIGERSTHSAKRS